MSALLDQGRTMCTPLLRQAVGRLAAPMDTIAAYHLGWIDRDGRPARAAGGKAVRPALALLSAEAVGGDASAGVPGGVAVELVHNFSLLHDDVMDGDEFRRHRATAWAVFGVAQAVLVGDALLALGIEVLLEAPQTTQVSASDAIRAVNVITSATRRLIDGQAQDLTFELREHVTVEECLEMEGNKTAALLAGACTIGAVLAGADAKTSEALGRYGHHVGLAFQSVDDLLGIWGAPEATGKPHRSDLRRHKKSLPVAAALADGGTASRRLAQLLADSKDLTDEDEEHLDVRADLIEQAGGRAWAQNEARHQYAAALDALDEIPMPDTVRQHFVAFADFVVVRET
ncbi:polyprenyl synthetase family protein [Catellatospora sp. NPDC049609]|uniref:polyprenyl synthetase family protein n=1 Tax=Catellatospora sp. NPDC049609 TaxID=3155505 RepID=UPI003433E153